MHAYSGRTDIVMITTHPPPRVYAEYEVAIHQQASAYQPSIGLAIKATGAPPCRRSATSLHFDAWSWSAPSVECENDKCSFESIYQSTANPKIKAFWCSLHFRIPLWIKSSLKTRLKVLCRCLPTRSRFRLSTCFEPIRVSPITS